MARTSSLVEFVRAVSVARGRVQESVARVDHVGDQSVLQVVRAEFDATADGAEEARRVHKDAEASNGKFVSVHLYVPKALGGDSRGTPFGSGDGASSHFPSVTFRLHSLSGAEAVAAVEKFLEADDVDPVAASDLSSLRADRDFVRFDVDAVRRAFPEGGSARAKKGREQFDRVVGASPEGVAVFVRYDSGRRMVMVKSASGSDSDRVWVPDRFVLDTVRLPESKSREEPSVDVEPGCLVMVDREYVEDLVGSAGRDWAAAAERVLSKSADGNVAEVERVDYEAGEVELLPGGGGPAATFPLASVAAVIDRDDAGLYAKH